MHADLNRLNDTLTQHLIGLDATQTQATPPKRLENWSIQQIVEHLLLTYRATIAVIQTRLDKGAPTRATPTLAQRGGQWMILDLGHFPAGRPAPDAVSPARSASPSSGAELMQGVGAELMHLDAVALEAEALFGLRRSVSHMILGPLSLAQWRRFHLVHGLHHARQIQTIRKLHSF